MVDPTQSALPQSSRPRAGLSRRELLTRAGTAAAALAAAPVAHAFDGVTHLAATRAVPRQAGPNDRIVVGLIGCNGMGSVNMKNLMRFGDVEVAALCDVDDDRIPGDFNEVKAKYGRDPKVYRDYRDMLERKDIDAVIIGTPDHWHALQLIHSCQAGKDSYCEKPISYSITEAQAMVRAQQRYNRVVQVGTWQRSTPEFCDAIALIRAGKLGRITTCRAWITDGTRIGRGKPSSAPKNLDYDRWIGPAAMVPYQSNKVHWNWRWVLNTGGGLSTDWGVHMMDIALLGMSKGQDLVMPRRVSAVGGNFAFPDDDRDAWDTIEAVYEFPDPGFVMHWSVGRGYPGRANHGTEFISEDGRTLRVWRGGWQILGPDGKELPKESLGQAADHGRNFLDCIKTRERPRADLASVAQTTMVCLMSNCALDAGGTVEWDAARNDLKGRTGRDSRFYRREYRRPYELPKV